eukprot:TRINITY_DN782_c0_g1_i1.p1 TRINITY_DN782_c0_g1~~TRINITY_DN782_c0_g1_i1.p1  ORF type:complete len:183 (+),score=22.91 TRINITY_DN782_c0_g1_i1:290-838(+)
MEEEERNLLSIGYKNVVGQLRAAHRTVILDDDGKFNDLAQHYKTQLEEELGSFCQDALKLFETVLPKVCSKSFKARVFHLKLVADYYRYLAEFSPTKENKNKATSHYKQAMDLAKANLEATHPILLGVALNCSVSFHEVLKDNENKTCQLDKKPLLNHAIAELDDLDELLTETVPLSCSSFG